MAFYILEIRIGLCIGVIVSGIALKGIIYLIIIYMSFTAALVIGWRRRPTLRTEFQQAMSRLRHFRKAGQAFAKQRIVIVPFPA